MYNTFPKPTRLLALAAVSAALLISACGGSGGSGGGTPPTIPTAESATILGTAAIGAAMVNANVRIVDRTGASACSNDPITTDATGAYRCVLTANSVAPFAIVATDPTGLLNPLSSILTTKPVVGSQSTSNITPLTTAIVAQLDPNKDAFSLLNNPSALASVSTDTLASITSNVIAQLGSVVATTNLGSANNFNPFSTPFVGGSGTGADQVLDQIRVTFDNGTPHLSNVLNPNVPSVPMAGTTTAPAVTISVVASTFSMAELAFAKTELERCFAVPASQRATTNNNLIASVATACQDFVVDDAPLSAKGADVFLNSGYSAQSHFYNLLTSSAMDNAQFNLPELMRYTPKSDGKDEALINIKFRDNAGFINNQILVAKNILDHAIQVKRSGGFMVTSAKLIQ
ncbi:MAG: hypothetical protein HC858_08975 [Brachymonas sp.]|nr:hypothetical protein [Brachymonas sp.]